MAKKIKTYGKANDKGQNVQDEITLAALIQNAAARGLKSFRGDLFKVKVTKENLQSVSNFGDYHIGSSFTLSEGDLSTLVSGETGLLREPPLGAHCACALGAQLLTPKVPNPVAYTAMHGNDAAPGCVIGEADDLDTIDYADLRSMQIGAAYEIALRTGA